MNSENTLMQGFDEIVSETTNTTLREMADVPHKLRLVRYRHDLGQIYLDALPDDIRQEYNCRTCLNFLNGIGSIAYISNDNQFIPLALNEGLLEAVPEIFKASFSAMCSVFSNATATDFEVLTTNMVQEYGLNFVGHCELGGYRHFGVDQNEISIVAVKDILAKHSVDLRERENGVGKAEATAIHNYLQDLIKYDFSTLINPSKLRARDLPIYQEILQVSETYKNNDHAIVVLKYLIDHGIRILTLRNTVVGALLTDIMNGLSFTDAYERYLSYVDPRNYKRPTRLPTETQFEESVAFLTEKGYDKFLPVRFAVKEEVTPSLNWVRDGAVVTSEEQPTDIFNDARTALKKDIPPANQKLIEHPLEKISLLSVESLIKEAINNGEMKSIELIGRTAFTGAFTCCQDADAGQLYKDGNIVHKFFGETPVPMRKPNGMYNVDNYEMDGILFERDDFNNPMITLVKFNAEWLVEVNMTVFPDDLISELTPHHRVIEHWARTTTMNSDSDGNVIKYDCVPMAFVISVGHGIKFKTATESFTFEITSLR